MNQPFFSRRNGAGLTNALLILMVVFFFVPFALRGARMALQKTENNVKDWLPDTFRETEELAWFAKHFVSEQFILATWSGCSEEDQRLKLFVDKLRAELAPGPNADENDERIRARRIGEANMLLVDDDLAYDWGGEKEKWLHDDRGHWYYLTPEGKLYRWDGRNNLVGDLWRRFQKLTGSFRLSGEYIATFGKGTEGDKNIFYRDPRLLTAPLFSRIQTGPELVQELTSETGPLHREGQLQGAKREAIDRLTGTLFAPGVPYGFDWTADGLKKLYNKSVIDSFPQGWDESLKQILDEEIEKNFAGSREKFMAAGPRDQVRVLYAFFDAMGLNEPARQTCALITLTEAGRRHLKPVIGRGMLGTTRGRVLQLAEESGVAPPNTPTTLPPPFSMMYPPPPQAEPILHMGGPPVDNVAIDEEGTITLFRLIGYSVVVGLALSWIFLRSIKLTVMVFFVGGVSAIASLSVVWWSGATIDAILLTMPSLVYVLGMAGAIHMINYYRDVVIEEGAEGAPEKALKHAFFPCLLANVTTALGLVSLCISEIAPIRKFGAFSAISVMATLLLIYTYVPAALATFVAKYTPTGDKPITPELSTRAIDRFWNWLGSSIIRNWKVVNFACIAVIAVFTVGLFQIRTSVHLLKMFDSNAQIIQDYSWLERNFGRLVPLELVVRFPKPIQRTIGASAEQVEDLTLEQARSRLSLLERAEAVDAIQRVVEREFGYSGADVLGHGMSALTLLRDLPDRSRGLAPQRLVFDGLLRDSFARLSKTDYLRTEPEGPAEGTELWRISLRLGALNDVDYGQFISQLRLAVEPVIAAYDCRKQVIDQIMESTKNNSDKQRFGAVLVLGQGNPAEIAPDAIVKPKSKERGDITKSHRVNSDLIFAETLGSLLENESVSRINWHDPIKSPLKDGKATSEKWAKYLSTFACVVIVGDSPDYDWNFIRKSQPNLIDARPKLAEIKATADSDRVATGVSTDQTITANNLDVIYTGVVPIVYKAQRTLLNSLIESTFWAFVTIAPVMAIILLPASTLAGNLHPRALMKAIYAGTISMAPNIFPIVMIFGAMGFLDIEIDIGSMMTASVAMGIAVDDTIHFLTWFRGGVRMGLPRLEAVLYAYRRVAPAMTQTAIIGGVGLSVFALSTFTPTQRFGTLMLTILSAAVLGDLIFLPAILASPLGKVFMPYPDPKSTTETGGESAGDYFGGDRGPDAKQEIVSQDGEAVQNPFAGSGNKSDSVSAGRHRPHFPTPSNRMSREDSQKNS